MQNVKGTYDFFGSEQAVRRRVQSILQETFELYDYESMDSSILNELELLASKYAGGDEILKEMYQLSDQGGRSLGLRYDLTIPFAKVIALNPSINLPFKRYEMGKVFRDGPVKSGRLREFLQCDVDVAGIEGPEAEAELMQLAVEVFKKLDIPIILKWNNRRFLGEVLEVLGIPAAFRLSVLLTLDKMAKIGPGGVMTELIEKGLNETVINALKALIELESSTFESISTQYGIQGLPGSQEVQTLQRIIQKLGLERTCQFDPFLSRGLSFYTGTVYEIFDASGGFTSSLGGGGRYDAIIGKLVGREDIVYPAVGLSFGMESIMEMLKDREVRIPCASVAVIPIGDTITEALMTASKLRSSGIRTYVDTRKRKLKRSLADASSRGTRFVFLIGEDEASAGKVTLKNMIQSTEATVLVEEAVSIVLNEK